MNATPEIEIKQVRKHFQIGSDGWLGSKKTVKALDGVSLKIFTGKTLGLVGESGCGKSTLSKIIMGLEKPTEGTILYQGQPLLGNAGIEKKRGNEQLNKYRKSVQMIFQDPYSSLNPRKTIGNILRAPLIVHGISKKTQADKLQQILPLVGLNSSILERYPHEFSGGQRQRIAIARALILEPKTIIADEPVSALDVSIQAQILNLLRELQSRLHLSLLFVAHDLAVVRYMSEQIAVMYLGRIVETANRLDLYRMPLHPYTQALLSSAPSIVKQSSPDGRNFKSNNIPLKKQRKKKFILKGEIPSPINPPSGCHFSTRCPFVDQKCRSEVPQLIPLSDELGDDQQRLVACHKVKAFNDYPNISAAPNSAEKKE